MRIDRRLNLIIDLLRTDGSLLTVHASPISSEIFDRFWEPISETVAAIFKGEHGIVTGPRIAHKMLRKQAQKLGLWDGPGGVQAAFMPEIRRLAHVLIPGTNGYELLPLSTAITKDLIDARETDEIEGRLVFFISCWEVILSEDQSQLLDRAAELWRVRLTSSSVTEYQSSLQTSTTAASSGAKLAAVS